MNDEALNMDNTIRDGASTPDQDDQDTDDEINIVVESEYVTLN